MEQDGQKAGWYKKDLKKPITCLAIQATDLKFTFLKNVNKKACHKLFFVKFFLTFSELIWDYFKPAPKLLGLPV